MMDHHTKVDNKVDACIAE